MANITKKMVTSALLTTAAFIVGTPFVANLMPETLNVVDLPGELSVVALVSGAVVVLASQLAIDKLM